MEKVSFMFSELSENDLRNIYGGESEEKGVTTYWENKDDGIYTGWINN